MQDVMQDIPISNPRVYPMWITLPGGQSVVVPNHLIHSALTGKTFDYDGHEVVAQPEPTAEAETAAEAEEDLSGIFAKPEVVESAEAAPKTNRARKGK